IHVIIFKDNFIIVHKEAAPFYWFVWSLTILSKERLLFNIYLNEKGLNPKSFTFGIKPLDFTFKIRYEDKQI
ncbi:hypothetical protein, partial [Natranaerobius trueperi]